MLGVDHGKVNRCYARLLHSDRPEINLLAKNNRKHLVSFLALLLLFGLIPSQSMALDASVHSPVQQQLLSNGLRVLMVEDHSFPVVSCLVWYKVGARNEQPGMTGLSHLVEHMLFHNVGNYRKGELGATIVRNGGQFNGFTSDDFTAFFETVHPSKVDLVLRIEAERMREANFASQDLKEEVTRINRDIDEELKDPQTALAREVRSTAFVQHPYRNPAIGWKPDLENITIQDVRNFYDRYYYPDNATLIVVGDFKAANTFASITKYFATLPKSPAPIPGVRANEPQQHAERRVTMHQPGKRDLVEVAYHAPALADADAPAVVVMEKLLNAHYSGRLKKLIDSKVTTTAHSAYELKKDPGLFTVNFNTAPGSLGKLMESWDSSINQIKDKGIGDAELRRARNLAEYAYYTERDGPYRLGFNLGFCESLQSWQAAETWPDKLRSVSMADIQRVARKYFTSENRVVGLLATPAPPAKTPGTLSSPSNKPPARPAPAAELEPRKDVAPSRKFEHSRLTGYKNDDNSIVVPRQIVSQIQTPAGGATNSLPEKNNSAPVETVNSTATPSQAVATPDESAKPVIKQIPVEATPSNIQKRVLKNGVTLLIMESHMAPVVQICGAVRAGSAFEGPNKKGISDVMTACLNNGSSRLSHTQLRAAQEDSGLPPNAMLHFEPGLGAITFRSRCLARDLQAMLNYTGFCLKDPLVQEPDLDHAKQEALAQYKQSDDTSAIKAERALLRSLLALQSPYYPDDLSTKANSISAFKPADLHEFHSQNVLPENTTIVIVGDITVDMAVRQAEQALGSWTARASTARDFPPVDPNPRRVTKTSIPIKDRSKTSVSIGRLVSPANSANYTELMMADCAMTNHPLFSRLAQRMSSDASLADNLSPDAIESRFMPLGSMVGWVINLPVEPNIVPDVAAMVQSELRKFARTGVTADEFAEVKRFLTNALPVRQFSTTTDAAKAVLDYDLQSGGKSLFNEQVNNLRASTLENLNRFIHNDLKPDQCSLVIVGTNQIIKRVHGGKTSGQAMPREASTPRDTRQPGINGSSVQNNKSD